MFHKDPFYWLEGSAGNFAQIHQQNLQGSSDSDPWAILIPTVWCVAHSRVGGGGGQ